MLRPMRDIFANKIYAQKKYNPKTDPTINSNRQKQSKHKLVNRLSHKMQPAGCNKPAGLLLHLATCCLLLVAVQPHRVWSHESLHPHVHLFPLPAPLVADHQLGSSCEPLERGFCSDMSYKSTRMPNFFKDVNQYDAMVRSAQYELLVSSKCSAHLHAYICQLLAPVCLDSDEAMRRFEIYPCRPFCRRVRRDCEPEILATNERMVARGAKDLLAGFACEKLPYEFNGGNGSQHGPCLELPEEPAYPIGPTTNQMRGTSGPVPPYHPHQASGYRPYQPALDSTNVPAYITDDSRIDPNMIPIPAQDPSSTIIRRPPHTNVSSVEKSFWDQVKVFGQQLAWILIRYSNVLSIITVLILMLALNWTHLRRIKSACGFRVRSERRSPNGSGAVKGPGFAVSPSSSSRSLMLIGGGAKQAPCHKLVDSNQNPEPSQKLLQALGQSQPTLVNVSSGQQASRTLEGSSRYLMMAQQQQHQLQYLDHHQQHYQGAYPGMFAGSHHNTLDSQSTHSNQYDYIQVEPQRPHFRSAGAAGSHFRQAEDASKGSSQVFSNILLSSPSKQVLLVDAEPPASRLRAARHGPYAAPSPYASSSEFCGRSFSRRRTIETPGTPSSAFGPRSGTRQATASSGASSSSGSSQSSSAALVSPPGRLLQ